jgi:glycine/D-amino acid oxidase-like deaminating enzyme
VTVLIVGAGPTGLTLAAQLRSFGTRFRIIDRQADRVHESRAWPCRPALSRSSAGSVSPTPWCNEGNPAVRVQLHAGARTTEAPLFDVGLDDTAYPFLLFLSQAETKPSSTSTSPSAT